MFYGGRFPTYSGGSDLGMGSGGSYGDFDPAGAGVQMPAPYQSQIQQQPLMPMQPVPQQQRMGPMDMAQQGLSYGKNAYDVYNYGQRAGLWGRSSVPQMAGEPPLGATGNAPALNSASGSTQPTGFLTPSTSVPSAVSPGATAPMQSPAVFGSTGPYGGTAGAFAPATGTSATAIPAAPFVAGSGATGAMTGVGAGTSGALSAGGATSEAAIFGAEAMGAGAAGAGTAAGTAAATGAAAGTGAAAAGTGAAAAGAGTAAAAGGTAAAAGGTAAAAGTTAAAAGMAAIPVVGWVAAAALMAYSLYEGGAFEDLGL